MKEKNQAIRKEERRQYTYSQLEKAKPAPLTQEQLDADVAAFLANKRNKVKKLPAQQPATKPVTAGKRSSR